MLASILPGLRDLRVPLATGFLWLVVLWLIVYPIIPTQKDAAGFVAEIYELFGALGSATLLAVMSFIAYLVGIVLGKLAFIPKIAATIAFASRSAVPLPGVPLSDASRRQAYELAERTIRQQAARGVQTNTIAETVLQQGITRTSARLADPEFAISDIERRLFFQMYFEVPLVAVRLLAKQKELFDRYDRADAEANFRYAIVVPLVAIIGLLAWRVPSPSIWLTIGLIVAALIFIVFVVRDAYLKQRESNDAIFQSVFVKEVQFPVLEEVLALEPVKADSWKNPVDDA